MEKLGNAFVFIASINSYEEILFISLVFLSLFGFSLLISKYFFYKSYKLKRQIFEEEKRKFINELEKQKKDFMLTEILKLTKERKEFEEERNDFYRERGELINELQARDIFIEHSPINHYFDEFFPLLLTLPKINNKEIVKIIVQSLFNDKH